MYECVKAKLRIIAAAISTASTAYECCNGQLCQNFAQNTLDAICAGNVATEDVVYLLSGLEIEHKVDMDKLLDASHYICSVLHKENRSNVAKALLAKRSQASPN